MKTIRVLVAATEKPLAKFVAANIDASPAVDVIARKVDSLDDAHRLAGYCFDVLVAANTLPQDVHDYLKMLVRTPPAVPAG